MLQHITQNDNAICSFVMMTQNSTQNDDVMCSLVMMMRTITQDDDVMRSFEMLMQSNKTMTSEPTPELHTVTTKVILS